MTTRKKTTPDRLGQILAASGSYETWSEYASAALAVICEPPGRRARLALLKRFLSSPGGGRSAVCFQGQEMSDDDWARLCAIHNADIHTISAEIVKGNVPVRQVAEIALDRVISTHSGDDRTVRFGLFLQRPFLQQPYAPLPADIHQMLSAALSITFEESEMQSRLPEPCRLVRRLADPCIPRWAALDTIAQAIGVADRLGRILLLREVINHLGHQRESGPQIVVISGRPGR